MCMTRKLLYTQSQTENVCQSLNALRPDLQKYDNKESSETEEIQNFQAKVKYITRTYDAVFSTSDSSWELIGELQRLQATDTIAEKIISYLAEEEAPMKLLTWEAEKYSKNQGKRLFNIIMHTF